MAGRRPVARPARTTARIRNSTDLRAERTGESYPEWAAFANPPSPPPVTIGPQVYSAGPAGTGGFPEGRDRSSTPLSPLDAVNRPLEREAPALLRALSPLGGRVVFTPDLPFQAGEE